MLETSDHISERKLGTVDKSFYLIAVGASAGGLDAIKQLISQIPPDFAHSLVIVQHISPDYKSLMSDILARETTLPVQEVSDNQDVEPGHIYLIPPRSNIVIQGTKGDSSARLSDGEQRADFEGLRFSLVAPTPRPAMNLAIDVFFNSLAEAVADRAIAIILSGTGSDGSRGLRTIKDRDGFVIVQEPRSAAFDGMPRAAIATGIVDLVLEPDAMAGEIRRYFEMRESGIMNVASVFKETDTQLEKILAIVSNKAEIEFSQYKEPTLKRRIARRMVLAGFENLDDYLEFLQTDGSEANVLHREFLVGVTNFFRDLPVWLTLTEMVLEELFSVGDPAEPVRIWSAGCSTGEEAYTIAMLLERYRRENGIEREFRIFATDVNPNSIDAAKQGIYPDSVREEIPTEYFDAQYLNFRGGTFTVANAIRKRVIFSAHNVIEDPPYTRTDMIVCRNLLIYLGADVQAKVMTHFSFSLRKGGILLLGAAETPGQHGAMFEAIVNKSRIFRNTRRMEIARARSKVEMEFPATNFLPRSRRLRDRSFTVSDDLAQLIQSVLDDISGCVCIAEGNGKLLRTFGDHENILALPRSGFSPNLLNLVDERLRSSIALVMRRAELDGSASKDDVKLIDDKNIQLVDISCRKVSWEAHPVAFAVMFRLHDETPHAAKYVTDENDDGAGNLSQAAYIAHLESEVQSLQDMLSATAEDLGASNEELQTTNEELIASNEELQANNEETQSINEELHTVNAENIEKITELEEVTSDINNLMAMAEIGILVLTNDMTIRRFGDGIKRYVDLEAGDVGRSIENFSFSLESGSTEEFMAHARAVCQSGDEVTRTLVMKDASRVLVRIRAYRLSNDLATGVLVTFLDTALLKSLEES